MSRRVAIEAGQLLAKYQRGRPLLAFWDSLKSSSLAVALHILIASNCGIEFRTTKDDGKHFLNNWIAGIGSTPLMLAAHANRMDVVKALVEKGAKVDAIEGEYGYSALHVAAADGHSEIVEYLIVSAKANPRILTKSGKTAAYLFETIGRRKNPSSEFRISNLLQD